MKRFRWLSVLCAILMTAANATADDVTFSLRVQSRAEDGEFQRSTRSATWPMESTAVIVCDVWDYHHCLNAVRRLDELTPRLNLFLAEARRRGATIIHSPSDCMEAYAERPSRLRATAAPSAQQAPAGIAHWRSRIAAEEQAVYPIDQSDGGEDDDPEEHAAWAAKLQSLGRNPAMPWRAQSAAIEIDDERDYISDRGDEVWNILKARRIQHVILTGVHANMCVLGRPFGLRQLVHNGKEVVFLRDLSDSMYNPARWPYVDHFTGHDLVVSHIERFVCPTITSDQLLGGEAFGSKFDRREVRDVAQLAPGAAPEWTLAEVPTTSGAVPDADVVWYRCAVRLPKASAETTQVVLRLPLSNRCEAWLNGTPFMPTSSDDDRVNTMTVDATAVLPDEANFLSLRIEARNPRFQGFSTPPAVSVGSTHVFELKGRWQRRVGDDPGWRNIPLPAKFGAATDVFFDAGD